MKLRILNNSLRLRLSQAEVTQLSNGEAVMGTIHFPGDRRLNYGIRPQAAGEEVLDLSFSNDQITLAVPLAQLQQWANSDTVGISASTPLGTGDTVRILVEKDFKCLTDRPLEDESDLFPHPETGEVAC